MGYREPCPPSMPAFDTHGTVVDMGKVEGKGEDWAGLNEKISLHHAS